MEAEGRQEGENNSMTNKYYKHLLSIQLHGIELNYLLQYLPSFLFFFLPYFLPYSLFLFPHLFLSVYFFFMN